MKRLIIPAILSLVAIAVIVSNVLAQTPPGPGDFPATSSEFQIVVTADSMKGGIGGSIGSLTALADGVKCEVIDVSDLKADALLRLGLGSQPPECAREGAKVTFTSSRGTQILATMRLSLGGRETLRNFLPPTPVVPNGLEQSQFYEIHVKKDAANVIGSLTTYADGQRCFEVNLSNATEDVVIVFNGDNQVEACTRDGAKVELVRPGDIPLTSAFILQNGKRDFLTNFAPRPPGSVLELATPTPSAPMASGGSDTGGSSGGTGTIRPPDTGDAGLR